MMITKMHGVLGLFILLVLVLMIKPDCYNNMYKTVLGRVVLIAIMLFFATNNVTLGLLVALIIILGTNISFVEGMDNQSDPKKAKTDDSATTDKAAVSKAMDKLGSKGKTIGDDSETLGGAAAPIQVTTRSTRSTSSTSKKGKDGVDRLTLDETMKPMNSKSVPIRTEAFKNCQDVEASNANDLDHSSKRQLEGFGLNRRTR